MTKTNDDKKPDTEPKTNYRTFLVGKVKAPIFLGSMKPPVKP